MNPDTSSCIPTNNITEESVNDNNQSSTSTHTILEEPINTEENTEVQNDCMSQGKDQNDEVSMVRSKINELDKFKRRLVRAVARLKINEKKTEDEIWNELKKETTWDCKSLWVRMRALTIKKLKRLCSVEDRLDMIAKVAHLSVTDWLMFDLVLVHEDIDVIGQEDVEEYKEPKILGELFKLVQEYQIERLSGDSLTRSWYDLTQKYNVRGRKCSPMLLQRRWYQMKVLVRYNFYNFWFSYRGVMRKLPYAKKYKPTELQMEIAKCQKDIITNPFQTWEELIKIKKVSLPSDFERLQLSKTKKKSLDNEPDLVVIEPEVETIDLRIESDTSEDESSHNINKKQDREEMRYENVKNAMVKSEVINDLNDEEDIRALESVEIPLESAGPKPYADPINNQIIDGTCNIVTSTDYNTNTSNGTNEGTTLNETNEVTVIEENSNESMPDNTNEGNDVDKNNDVTVIDENCDESMPDNNGTIIDTTPSCLIIKNNVISGVVATNITEKILSEQSKLTICKARDSQENLGDNIDVQKGYNEAGLLNSDNVGDDIVSEKDNVYDISETTESTDLMMPKITSVHSKTEVIENIEEDTPDEINTILEGVVGRIIENKFDNIKIPEKKFTIDQETSVSSSPDIIDIDEDIAKVANSMTVKKSELQPLTDNEPEDLLSIDGLEIEDEGIAFIDEEDTTEIMNKTEQEEESNEDNTQKIDLKLLLDPVVYTKKLDDMNVFRFIDYIAVKDGRAIENAVFESRPVDKKSVKMEHISEECQNEYESDICSDDSSECSSHLEIISSKSWLFRKPKVLSYNPIQLCKNPDFNKRLNRLTAGFFSSERNRWQLKQCKPLTIDLHKCFEIKLKNNSLIVGGFGTQVNKPTETVTAAEKTAIPPSDLCYNIINAVDRSIASIPTIATTDEFTLNCKLNATDNSVMPMPSIATTDNSMLNHEIINTTEKPVSSIPTIQSAPAIAADVNYSERNKIINLPNYDKIRRANEKLLIAEVAPIQVVNKNPPVAIIPGNYSQIIGQSKNDLQNKEYSKDSPIISLIETNDNHDVPNKIPNISVNTDPKKTITEKLSYYQQQKLNRSINEKLKKIIKPSAHKNITKPTTPPVKLVAPEYVSKESTIDRLLASDTVDRILSICQGDHGPSTKREQKNEAIKVRKKGATVKNKVSGHNPTSAEYKFIDNPVVNDSVVPVVEKDEGTMEITNETIDKPNISEKKGSSCYLNNAKTNIAKYKNKRKKQKGFCCWAQEKFLYHKFLIHCVKSRHKCPSRECNCCCKELLEKIRPSKKKVQVNKIFSPIDLVSDDESEENKPNNNTKMRNVGINTDYDPDFAGSLLAASMINNFDFNVTQHVQQLGVLKQTSNNETQTCNNDEDTTNLMISVDSGIIDMKMDTEKLSPVITNVRSLSGTEPFVISNFKVNKRKHPGKSLKFKCKTNIVPAAPIKIAPKITKSSNILQQAPESLKKIKMLTPDNNVYLINDKSKNSPSHKPISVGKNKILLCSFKPLNINSTTDDQVMKQITSNNLELINSIDKESQSLLPHGVHLIMLPSQEIALSIEPGIELNPSQLSDLPAIIAKVQQQFNNKVFKQIKESCIKNLNTDYVIQLSDDESTERTEKSNSPQKTSEMEISEDNHDLYLTDNSNTNMSKASEMEISKNNNDVGLTDNLTTNMQKISEIEISADNHDIGLTDSLKTNMSKDSEMIISKNNNDVGLTDNLKTNMQKISEIEISADNHDVGLTDSLKTNMSKDSEMIISKNNNDVGLTDNLKTKISINESNKLDIPDTIKSVNETPADECPEISNENVNLEENTNSILKTDPNSEQSVHSDDKTQSESNIGEKSVGDLGKKTILSDLMEMVGISEEDTGITNTDIQSQKQSEILNTYLETLSENCSSKQIVTNSPSGNLALAAPLDLNIITSFIELKYAYENNGYFYKMDVETGKVAPINVCIKKQPNTTSRPHIQTIQLSRSLVPKSVIDLTDDQEKEVQLIPAQKAPSPNLQKSQQQIPKAQQQNLKPKQQTLKAQQQNLKPKQQTLKPLQQNLKQQTLKSPIIKPIRLFKAIHTPIIKHSGKSLLMKLTRNNPEFQAKRKKLMLMKPKRKQDFNLLIPDDMSSVKANDSSGTIEKNLNNISDSDDEPLALKVKRKRKDETVEDIDAEKLEKTSEEECTVLNEITDNESSSVSGVTNFSEKPHIDFMDTEPQLEPIAYNDTSDEDCILGV